MEVKRQSYGVRHPPHPLRQALSHCKPGWLSSELRLLCLLVLSHKHALPYLTHVGFRNEAQALSLPSPLLTLIESLSVAQANLEVRGSYCLSLWVSG